MLLHLLLPQGEWIYNKWESPTFPDAPLSISSSWPSWKVQLMYHVPQKAKGRKNTARWQMFCSCPTRSTGREATRILTDSVTTSCCSLWWSLLPIPEHPSIHQNIPAAARAEQSQLRKQLLYCLWATCASRVIGWPLLFLFQLFYLAACSKKKAACSQKCIFPLCEIWPAPESLISLSQIRNLSYSQFTLAEN